MLTLPTVLGLILVTGGSTAAGSAPVLFHRYLKDASWNWWESFGGGVMLGASIFSLFLPAIQMIAANDLPYTSFLWGLVTGLLSIYFLNALIKKITENLAHQRAYLFVLVMAIHNIPEGLAVGVDVAAMGWRESLPLCAAISLQNFPEGLVSSMSFLISGFSLKAALLANGVTALIEALSSLVGYKAVGLEYMSLPFLFSFSGACMSMVVFLEMWKKKHSEEAAAFSLRGFCSGFFLCAALDFFL